MNAWAETIRGNLGAAEQAAEQSRAGFGTGQAASFVLGATCWRIVALHALGRWDEVMVEAVRAERALEESQLTAPWYAYNGFLSILATARSRGDIVRAEHWKRVMLRITDKVEPDGRIRRILGYLSDDLEALEQGVLHDFRFFTPRLDYVHLAAGLLADRRFPASVDALSAVIDYTEARDLLLPSSQVRRLRGIVTRSRDDLQRALDGFTTMGAAPFAARARTELGLLDERPELLDAGLDELERLGDVEHATRVAAERRAGALAGAPAG